MDNQPPKKDPIRARYYRPLELAEACSDWLFWIVVLLSVLALAVERISQPKLYDLVQGGFILGVLALFFLGQGIRLYWAPRAEDKRRQDLLSNSFSVPITHEQTIGYYNNEQTNPFRRLCVSLLENSFFSKSIALKMAERERVIIVFYTVVWIIVILYRSSDLALGVAVAQAVFSEQIFAKWIRLEWLRMRFERIYDGLYRLNQTTRNFNKDEFRIRALESFGEYETSKGYGNAVLSTAVFERLNHNLSVEWMRIKETLNV